MTIQRHMCTRGLTSLFGSILGLFLISGLAQAKNSPPPFAQDQPTEGNPFAQLHYRHIGPGGNRVSAVVGEPGNPLVIYAGAADGGIWNTTDGGINWKPIFDHQDVSAIGALAIAPSDHKTVWAGTGETWIIRNNYSMGDGIYKSTDAGATWQHMGLDLTGHIGRILVDPRHANIVYACAMGQAYRPQKERGIFRTKDGGKTWKQILSVDQNTGCSELSLDAHDPKTLLAGMWQVAIHSWNLDSGGTGSGVYISHDGGDTWKKLSGNGLPAANKLLGKVAVQIAPSDSNRMYALIQEETPRLYRSDNHGNSWELVNQQHILSERSPYYTRFAVAPDDENFLLVVAVAISHSRDGGKTLADDITIPAGDVHDVWYDPQNPDRVMVAHDHGISVSLNREKTFQQYTFPIAQMYHVFADEQIPYFVYGNRQDEPTFRGPSNSIAASGFRGNQGILAGDWTQIGGCEPGFAIPDWSDNNIIWSGCYNGDLTRMDLRSGQARWVSAWPEATYGWAPKDVKYRWHWTMPIAMSPHDHNVVYVGSQYLHETSDAGQSWKVVSPDLTRNDKSHQQNSGGVSVDNLMTFEGSVLYAIAESPLKAGLIWTGSTDGQVNITQDGGKTWTNVTKNIPNLPPWGTIFRIEPSHFDAGIAYVVVNLRAAGGNYDPYVYKTADYGKTWRSITSGIPKSVNSSVNTIVEDPVRQGMLFLGTSNFIYVSWNDGMSWTLLRNNMPPAPIAWLTIQKHYNDLVVATYGRGIWILDDITPLRTFDLAKVSEAYFFKPRQAYRYREMKNSRNNVLDNDHQVGENPPDGADLNYFLKSGARNVEISVVGPSGEAIRTLKGSTAAGINRVWWDLRYEAPIEVKLRNSPPGEPWVKNGPKGWRRLVHWRNYTQGPKAWPGMYTVHLKVDGQEFSQPLEVMHDPKNLATVQDTKSNTEFLLQLRSELDQAAEAINRIELTRAKLTKLKETLAGDSKNQVSLKAVNDIERRIYAVEGKFFPLELTGRTEDAFRAPTTLYGKLTNLAWLVEGGADMPPTDQSIAVGQQLQQQLAEALQATKTLYESEISQFNSALKARGIDPETSP
ncbi:MAG: hypothetical protein ABI076_00950 [Acidobacteriaceae bacterium]